MAEKYSLWCGWHDESGFDEDTLSGSEEVSWRKIKHGDFWDLRQNINLGGIVKEMQSIGWTVRPVLIVPADYRKEDVKLTQVSSVINISTEE